MFVTDKTEKKCSVNCYFLLPIEEKKILVSFNLYEENYYEDIITSI